MSSVLLSLIAFVFAIGLLVTVHEFGHFWVARRCGVKVLRFSVGFGKPLYSWRRQGDDTEYVLAAIPLGGYVQMLDEREGDVAEEEKPFAFNRKPVSRRLAVVAAGPAANFLLAICAYWLIFMLGVTGLKPIIGEVTEGSIAAGSGLKSGDRILKVDAQEVNTWDAVFFRLLDVAYSGEAIIVNVETESGGIQNRSFMLDKVAIGEAEGDVMQVLGIAPLRPVLPAVIEKIEAGGAADKAGLKRGDKVLSANGTPVKDWPHWVEIVQDNANKALRTEIERAGAKFEVMVTPVLVKEGKASRGKVGASVQVPEDYLNRYQAVQRYGVLEAFSEGVKKTYLMSVLTVKMLWRMITGDVSVSNVSGPISIAQYAGYSAAIGVVPFISFLAIISISLGVLNLLPVPVLDGGHILYFLIEAVKGSPVSEAVQHFGQRLGIVLLGLLMLLAFYNDLARLLG